MDPEPVEPALLDAILAAPDDDAAYLVYGDWLQTQGAARGKLIALHAAKLDDTELLRAHPELLPPPVDHATMSVDWDLGFWRRLAYRSSKRRDGYVASLLAHPSAALLRELDLSFSPDANDEQESFVQFDPKTKWPALERLTLTGLWIADAQAAFLATLPRLTHLSAPARNLTVAGVASIASLPLTSLKLANYVPWNGFAPLAKHPSLRNLEVHSLAPGDARALASIEGLVDLSVFSGFSSNLDGATLEHLAPLGGHLRTLRLWLWLDLDDSGCEHLSRFVHLERLSLDRAGITDACIDHLVRLEHLKLLNIADTEISARGVAELAQRMPWLEAIGLDKDQRRSLTADPRLRDRSDGSCNW